VPFPKKTSSTEVVEVRREDLEFMASMACENARNVSCMDGVGPYFPCGDLGIRLCNSCLAREWALKQLEN